MQAAVEHTCQIRVAGETEYSTLQIRLFAPVISGNRYEAGYKLDCKHFNERRRIFGADAMQGLLGLPMAVHAELLAKQEQGFQIHQHDPGDLAELDFWGATTLTFAVGGPEFCPGCGTERPLPQTNRSIAAAHAETEPTTDKVEEARARRKAERRAVLCTREIARRECRIRCEGDTEFSPLTVRFFAPSPDPSFDFRAEFSLESRYFSERKPIYGVDPIQALLLMPLIAHTLLLVQEDNGCEVYYREPGDLHDPAFWGVTRLTYDGGKPNRCGICNEERPVSPEVAAEQRALLSTLSGEAPA